MAVAVAQRLVYSISFLDILSFELHSIGSSNFDVLGKKKCFSALASNYHGDGETEPWPLTTHAFRPIF